MENLDSVVAIYDKKLKNFEQVCNVRKPEEAVRDFGVLKGMKETKYGLHPDDFDLYKIGSYDRETGILTSIVPPELL